MKLASRELGVRAPESVEGFGDGTKAPIVVLHGLYGSARNWSTAGRKIAAKTGRRAVGVDLRNHGSSPHAETMTYAELAADVVEWLDAHAIERAVLIGHSLGGKTALAVACRHARRVEALLVVDIAPRRNRPDPSLLEALLAVDLESATGRPEIELSLREAIPDEATRLFLLTNLVRDNLAPDNLTATNLVAGSERFRWQANLTALQRSLDDLGASPLEPGERYDGPTTFLVGGRSGYVRAADEPVILEHFPHAKIVVFENSGHNVHVEGGDAFVEAVASALDRGAPSG
jgi:pimeloyl-ACP methyl ester carboxylesterase